MFADIDIAYLEAVAVADADTPIEPAGIKCNRPVALLNTKLSTVDGLLLIYFGITYLTSSKLTSILL